MRGLVGAGVGALAAIALGVVDWLACDAFLPGGAQSMQNPGTLLLLGSCLGALIGMALPSRRSIGKALS